MLVYRLCLLFRHYKPRRERYAVLVGLGRPTRLVGTEVKTQTSLPSFDSPTMPSQTARMGDEGKAVGCVLPTALLFSGELHQNAPRLRPRGFAPPLSLLYIRCRPRL
jgi:hypothetical protein